MKRIDDDSKLDVVSTILETSHANSSGDGKIFVSNIEEVVDITKQKDTNI